MTNEIAKDYLGHTCRFTEAKEAFELALKDAQEKEFRVIKRTVGDELLNLNERLHHSFHAARAICASVQSVNDTEEPHALLAMLTSYESDTLHSFSRLAGLVLAGLEAVDDDPKDRCMGANKL